MTAGIGSRREYRERILSLLYEAETKDQPIDQLLDSLPVPPAQFTQDVLLGVAEHQDEIDLLIGTYAEGWTVERMPALDRAVLRMSTYELLYNPETPAGAIISEAVELASEYSTDRSSRFVNGLLARLAEETRTEGDGVG